MIPPRFRSLLRAASVAIAVALLCVPAPRSARAHGGLQPLDTWGGFSPSASYCQRIVGAASASCALRAARLRSQCLDARMRGLPCDESATSAAIVAVRRQTLDLVSLHCEEQDAIAIGYLSADFDLPADIIRFCREWEAISSSAAYGPVGASPSAADQDCIAATAATVAKLAQAIFDAWRGTMNRIAVRTWNLDAKESMIDHCSARVADFAPDAVSGLLARCEASRFEAIYRRSAAELVSQIITRANCFPWAFYLQDKLTCPAPVCGNWIVEPGEMCDDGNTAAGDSCDPECLGL